MKKEYTHWTIYLFVTGVDIVMQSLQGADNIITDIWDDRSNFIKG